MSEIYRTGDPDPPWDDPTSTKRWHVWQEPEFRWRHPFMYQMHRWEEEMNTRTLHLATACALAILVGAPVAYWLGWL